MIKDESNVVGLMPQWLWKEKVNAERFDELTLAIKRYIRDNQKIPGEWIDELVEIIKNYGN